MEGNSQGRAQLEVHTRNNLSLEVENFRALLTIKRVQSCTIAWKQSLEAMTLWYTPLVDIMGTAPGPVNSNRLL